MIAVWFVVVQNGRMYVANYEMFAGVPTFHQDAEHRYICAPICLLYLNSKSELIPIAIQVRVTYATRDVNHVAAGVIRYL